MDARGGARVKSTGRGKAHKSTDYQPKRVPVQCVFGWWEWSSKRGTKGDPGDLLRQSTSPFCGSINTRVHQNIKKFSEFYSHLIYVVSIWKKTKNAKKFLAWPPFCRKCPFYTHAFKSGKWIKQTPISPFWGDVGVKKWSQILDSGTRSPIFGHLEMPKVPIFSCPKMGSSPLLTPNTHSHTHLLARDCVLNRR